MHGPPGVDRPGSGLGRGHHRLLTITLRRCGTTDIATLYAHLFGQADVPADMLSPLVELADGKPLYAHEYGRMLVEQGTLRQSGPSWTLEQRDDLPMPDSVHAVIANRVDLLDRPTGRSCWPRGGRHEVLAGRGRRRAAPRSSPSTGRCAAWSSAISSTSSRRR